MSRAADQIVDGAKERARARGHLYCEPLHILEAVLEDCGHPKAAQGVTRGLDERPRLPYEPVHVKLSHAARTLIDEALAVSSEEDEAEQLLRLLLGKASPIDDSIRTETQERLDRDRRTAKESVSIENATADAGKESSVLRPLTVSDIDRDLVDRPGLVDQVLLTLMFGSPLIVGASGSGRRSLIRLVLRRIASSSVPPALSHVKFVGVSPTDLVAGTQYRGELEKRVQQIVAELVAIKGKAVLYVENLAALLSASAGTGGVDPVAALIPHLREGRVALIGVATQDEVRTHIESRIDLSDCLSSVYMPSLGPREAEALLANQTAALHQQYDVECDGTMIEAAVRLAHQHVPQNPILGTASRLLHGAASMLSYESAMLTEDPGRQDSIFWKKAGLPGPELSKPVLAEQHLLMAVAHQHRIPFEHLDRDTNDKIRELRDCFSANIFGQDHVLDALTATLKVALTNLSAPRQPRGRLFFVGPPGTGKTECARLLAENVMGDAAALLRFNMSEFIGESAKASLIGADKGLVRSEEGGRLTEPLRENPHRIVLFDEIEKATDEVHNLFLQILDDGQIEDNRGRIASFRHAICVFTSNVGCEDVELYGMGRDELEKRFRPRFRQEFLDRIEMFVPFRRLSMESRRKICELHLRRFRDQVKRVQGAAVMWRPAVVQLGAGDETQSGARHILRWIQNVVKPKVIDAILAVDDPVVLRIELDAARGEIQVFDVSKAKEAAAASQSA